jgi:hypothetical protein
MSIQCFLVKATDWALLYARRYKSADDCPGAFGFHNAKRQIDYKPVIYNERRSIRIDSKYDIPLDSLLWPVKCEYCDYVFTEQDAKQNFIDQMYAKVASEDVDTSKITLDAGLPCWTTSPILLPVEWWPKRALPVGALFRQPWMKNFYWTNETEDPLTCIVPSILTTGRSEWAIDSRCSNCSLPDDTTHRCWVRTGDIPYITVGKGGSGGGVTCAAGAGSIKTQGFHGMLTNGQLSSLGDSQIQI